MLLTILPKEWSFFQTVLETLSILWPSSFGVGSVAAGASLAVPQRYVCEVIGSEGQARQLPGWLPIDCS